VFLTSVRVRGTVANPSDYSLRVELEFIVDAGAIYTVIPKSVAEGLRLKETGRRKFKIANGDVVEYPVSEAYIIVNAEGATSVVAIADEKTPVLLGVTTLELLGLRVDPVAGKLTLLELRIM